jgi:hypothetical protein
MSPVPQQHGREHWVRPACEHEKVAPDRRGGRDVVALDRKVGAPDRRQQGSRNPPLVQSGRTGCVHAPHLVRDPLVVAEMVPSRRSTGRSVPLRRNRPGNGKPGELAPRRPRWSPGCGRAVGSATPATWRSDRTPRLPCRQRIREPSRQSAPVPEILHRVGLDVSCPLGRQTTGSSRVTRGIRKAEDIPQGDWHDRRRKASWCAQRGSWTAATDQIKPNGAPRAESFHRARTSTLGPGLSPTLARPGYECAEPRRRSTANLGHAGVAISASVSSPARHTR